MAWKEEIQSLAREIEGWLPDAQVKVIGSLANPIPDEPILEIRRSPEHPIRLEPARTKSEKLPTVVNLYEYPTLKRVKLVGPSDGAWEVQTSEGVSMNYHWNKEGFLQLLTALSR